MIGYLLVGLGGFFGSILRYASSQVFLQFTGISKFPFGTLFVNLLGSFLIGVSYAWLEKEDVLNLELRQLLIIGFLGGFTTFSAFSFENYQFIKNEQFLLAVIYTLGSILLGIYLVYLGYRIFSN